MQRYTQHRQRLMLRELASIVDRVAKGEIPYTLLNFEELTFWMPEECLDLADESREEEAAFHAEQLFERGYRFVSTDPDRWIPRTDMKGQDYLPMHRILFKQGEPPLITDHGEDPTKPFLKLLVKEGIITDAKRRKIQSSCDAGIRVMLCLFAFSEEERAFQAFQDRPELAPYMPAT